MSIKKMRHNDNLFFLGYQQLSHEQLRCVASLQVGNIYLAVGS